MGFIGSSLGFDSGNTGGAGLNFQAASAGITNPVTTDQINTGINTSQGGLDKYLAFLNAVSAQGGLQNQTDVYKQLAGISAGTGPNPAQTMLNNATGANTANTAALMAGQRGSSANVGLMARQIGMQGAATQQQAVGQGANLQANQSLGALQSMGNIAGQQVATQAGATTGYNQAAQSQEANLLGAQSNFNNSSVGNMASQNSANAGVSAVGAKGQQALLGGVMNGGAAAMMAKGGTVNQPPTMMATGGTAPAAAPPQPNMPLSAVGRFLYSSAPSNMSGSAAPTAANPMGQSNGQQDPLEQGGYNMAKMGGKGIKSLLSPSSQPAGAPQSSTVAGVTTTNLPMQNYGGGMNSYPAQDSDEAASNAYAASQDTGTMAETPQLIEDVAPTAVEADAPGLLGAAEAAAPAAAALARGGRVPALLSPGEVYLPPNKARQVAQTGQNPLKAGQRIPGQARVAGNSYANDTVPKTLEAGGIVIPRSITEAPDAPARAAQFVAAHLARKGRMPR